MCPRHAKFWKQVAVMAATLMLLLALAPLAEACPQCQKALAGSNGGVGGRIVQGYMWSILFMLSMPFVLLGSMSTYFYMLVRRARREQAAAQLATA
ncbi:MAG: hypothetical protein K1X71_19610 [Pirellulales bacterium]|nr:hypothetical protein [Pirellulales bacterium]